MNEGPRNIIQILDAVRKGKNVSSKKDVHLETGIAWGTMCKIVDGLLADGFIFARQQEPTGRGRPTIPLCINPESAYFMGIDIGASQTKAVVCDLAFNVLYKESHPTPFYRDETSFLEWLFGVYDCTMAGAKVSKSKLLGIGMAVSGSVDTEKGLIVSGGNFGLKSGGGLSVAKLAFYSGVKVHCVNTQAAAVWAEYHFGEKAGCGNLVTVGLGIGIGSGVVSNHQLILSHPTRQIGYIGHILIPGNRHHCVCGFKGCIEAYSGGRSLALICKEAIPERPDLRSAQALDLAATAGDPKAKAILLKAAIYNAVGIANMIQLYSPEVIVFSGGQSLKNGFVFTQTLKALDKILPQERQQNISMLITRLDQYQSALGAARMAYEKFF